MEHLRLTGLKILWGNCGKVSGLSEKAAFNLGNKSLRYFHANKPNVHELVSEHFSGNSSSGTRIYILRFDHVQKAVSKAPL